MKKYKKGEIIKNIFKAVGVGLAFGATIVMPGFAIGLKSIMETLGEEDVRINKDKVKRSLRRLEKRKLVSLRQESEDLIVEFSKEGTYEVYKYKIKELIIKKSKKWDKKWRIVIFDVPENMRLARDILRRKLDELGFISLQKSVFVYPYPCQKEIKFLVKILVLESYVIFIEADYIGNQKKLAHKFGLYL